MKRRQILSKAEALDLDDKEVIEGYFDGRAGEPEPRDNRSYSYWHGWTKGALDAGLREKTSEDAVLAAGWLECP